MALSLRRRVFGFSVFALSLTFIIILVANSADAASPARSVSPAPLPSLGAGLLGGPMVLSNGGDTTWVQVHTSSSYCPGDPALGHGGEATGGPGPLETWCFEAGDACGTNPPWDTRCFTHADVRTQPSEMGINFWHVDTYRAHQRPYCGDYALWCGSDGTWEGQAVECGTWEGNAPGYGNRWNCVVQLTLPDTFNVAAGCTLLFDPRYDTECVYDYFYVDFWNGAEWKVLATFNSSSNNPGGTCGPGYVSPDYFGNSDAGQPTSADWQERTDPGRPAFEYVLTPGMLVVTSGPEFRWRFTSDASASDADGRIDTDGGAWIDNVEVRGDGEAYSEDFEAGTLDTSYWSLPDPDGLVDGWHLVHDPDPPNEGDEGGVVMSCRHDSSIVWRGRPEEGYPAAVTWRNGWSYALLTPAIPISQSGCVIQYDYYWCFLDYTCDYPDFKVRVFDGDYGRWCPWQHYQWWWEPGCYGYWSLDNTDDLSGYYGETADSIQFAWGMQDYSRPGDPCRGKHKSTDVQVDNVSVGLYDASGSYVSARTIDLLHDTFHQGICAFNSSFDAYDTDTISHYWGGVELPWARQLGISVTDPDTVAACDLAASKDGGITWITVGMDLRDECLYCEKYTADFSGTVCPADFGDTAWAAGSEIWYYVKVTDNFSNQVYFPSTADPSHPGHTGAPKDYLTFSVLPYDPEASTEPKILLVDGYGRKTYDWGQCLGVTDAYVDLESIYLETLEDAGYCVEKYDIGGAGSSTAIPPIWYDAYDAVIWFTGPHASNYLFGMEAEFAIVDYLAAGGKVLICGDRCVYALHVVGEDSTGGIFTESVLGALYQDEMESPFDKPYIYAAAVDSVVVFGDTMAVDFDTLLVYRSCPELKDMTYVEANPAPSFGFTVQPLLEILNPNPAYAPSHLAMYTEYLDVGQCVFTDFDWSACVNHVGVYCDGAPAEPAPTFTAGFYEGRVDLALLILEDIFGLEPSGGGLAEVRPDRPQAQFKWSLHQNAPNPVRSGTEITYEIAAAGRVTLEVYDVTGRAVRVIEAARKAPGRYVARWDGRNLAGERVASGVYFYRITAGDFQATRKMIVLE
jgi:hypothetical protein